MKHNSGQIILVLILISTIGLTIGLSLISRSITDVRISSQIEESSKAFSAAEAGIEAALRSGLSVPDTQKSITLPGSEAQYSIENAGDTVSGVKYNQVPAGKIITQWFIDHTADGTPNFDDPSPYPLNTAQLNICWNTASPIMMTVLYRDGASYKIAKIGLDTEEQQIANFTRAVAAVNCGPGYSYHITVNPHEGTTEFWPGLTLNAVMLIALRIQPVSFTSDILILPQGSPPTPLPVQGKSIVSVGKTDTGVVQKIQVLESYSTLPEIFDFTYFSAN